MPKKKIIRKTSKIKNSVKGPGRDRDKERRWRSLVDKWQKSGLEIRAFCRRENLQESSFYFWRRELARRGQEALAVSRKAKQKKEQPKFVPVAIVNDDHRASLDRILEIRLGSGHILIIGRDCDGDMLDRVIGILEKSRC